MRYRWVRDDNRPGHYVSTPAPIPQHWIPDFRPRWNDWRDGRRNLRRAAEQDMVAPEIHAWLNAVLAPWPGIDPRDELATDMLAALQDPNETDPLFSR